MLVGVLGRRRDVGSTSSSVSADCTHATFPISLQSPHILHILHMASLRGRVRAARCLSLLSGEALPLEDARVRGFEDKECECDFRTGGPSYWPSWLLSWVAEDVAESPDGGRGEATEDEEVPVVGRGRAEGSRRPPGLRELWALLWAPLLGSTMGAVAMPCLAEGGSP